MSGLEIERKFLVKKGDAYKSAAFSSSHIQQGYIPAEGATVRVRTRDEKAYLTIKGKSVNPIITNFFGFCFLPSLKTKPSSIEMTVRTNEPISNLSSVTLRRLSR